MSRMRVALAEGAGAFSRAMGASFHQAFLAGDDVSLFGSGSGRSDGLDAVWTRISVASLAQAVRLAPRRLMDDEDRLVEDGPLTRLLDRPNPLQGWAEFVEVLCVQLLTPPGATAIVLETLSGAGGGTAGSLPTAMHVVDAEQLTPIWSPGEIVPTLVGYEFTTRHEMGLGSSGGGRRDRLEPWRVIPIRIPDGTTANPVRGLAPQGSSRSAIEIDRSMAGYAAKFFQNGAFAGAMFTTDATLTEAQLKTTRSTIDKRHRGVGNAWRTMLLHRGLKPVPTQSHRDMAFPELAKMNRERQLAPYGVPPLQAGIVDDANRSNSEAQIVQFITGAVAALADRIATAINEGLVARFNWTDAAHENAPRVALSRARWEAIADQRRALGREIARRRALGLALRDPALPDALRRDFTGAPERSLYLCFDFDMNPAVARNKLGQAGDLKILHEIGVPTNALLDLADFALPREPTGEIAFLPFNLVPASSAAKADEPEAKVVEPKSDAKTEVAEDAESERAERGAMRVAAIRGIAARHRASWAPIDGALGRRAAEHVRRQGVGVVARLRAEAAKIEGRSDVSRGALPSDAIGRVVFDLEESQGAIEAIARPFARATAELGAGQGLDEGGVTGKALRDRVDILVNDPRIRESIASHTAEFRLVEAERRDDLLRVIHDALDPPDGKPGRTFAELVGDIEGFYDGARSNAKRTATTETGKVLGRARHVGLAESGVDGHSWLTTSDNPRPAHAEAAARYEDDPIPITEAFEVGGEALMHPGDPAGSPGNIISCYCVEVAAPLPSSEEGAGRGFLGMFGAGRTPRRWSATDAAIGRYANRAFLTAEALGIDVEGITADRAGEEAAGV